MAPVLYRLKEEDGRCYQRIVDTLRLVLPFFSNFELEPDNGHLLLAWRERNSDQVFDVSQASDGMLRVMALILLLLQPEESLPDVLILDEPELGLHPYAITVIGGLIRAVSRKVQVIVATQSTAFVDCFEPADIVVVERKDRKSVFRRLDTKALREWLEDYSLSELWEKNVLGGPTVMVVRLNFIVDGPANKQPLFPCREFGECLGEGYLRSPTHSVHPTSRVRSAIVIRSSETRLAVLRL